MPFLKRVRVPEKCPKCKGTYDKFGRKAHVCYPARDREELPENRPELHHREDLKAALSPKRKSSKQEPPITAHGAAIIDILIPKDAPPRKVRLLKKTKDKGKQEESNQPVIPETEARYESPQAVRDMDYSKSWAHAYREDGHGYGSYPSFDGCDDESNP